MGSLLPSIYKWVPHYTINFKTGKVLAGKDYTILKNDTK